VLDFPEAIKELELGQGNLKAHVARWNRDRHTDGPPDVPVDMVRRYVQPITTDLSSVVLDEGDEYEGPHGSQELHIGEVPCERIVPARLGPVVFPAHQYRRDLGPHK